jgi:cyanophycinase-like exopeptidase
VYCEIQEHRITVDRVTCVVVTMKHKTNIIGQTSYPVSARRNGQTCPQP